MFTSVICSGMLYPNIGIELPNGITEIDVSAKITAIMGAARNSGLYTCGGVRSSLNRNLIPSAAGCNNPNGPTRVGPHRFCMWPTTLRSSHTVYATAVSRIISSTSDLTTETIMKSQIGKLLLPLLSRNFSAGIPASVGSYFLQFNFVTLQHRLQRARITAKSA